MKDSTSPPSLPPRDSATVVLLRDTRDGLEVFLMKRSGLSDTFGEAYVFPGGKLDAHDQSPPALAALDTPLDTLAQQLGEPGLDRAVAAGLYVAALREMFEEAGVLLSPESSRPAGPASSEWQAWLVAPDRQLHASRLVPWSRWITPQVAALSNKRFDTRFFLALVPHDQIATHDNFETTASVWIAPKKALLRYERGEIEMAPPQIMSLAHLARYTCAADALQAAREKMPPCICPENFVQNSEVVLCYPGDPLHSIPERALPGPTRLTLRNKRYVPMGGWESLWA